MSWLIPQEAECLLPRCIFFDDFHGFSFLAVELEENLPLSLQNLEYNYGPLQVTLFSFGECIEIALFLSILSVHLLGLSWIYLAIFLSLLFECFALSLILLCICLDFSQLLLSGWLKSLLFC